ncbi:MAG: hypothetical protein ACI959_001613 [Limisphaerales bacterium]|jgi:hypothetical protein
MLNSEFWQNRYETEQTGWDLGAASPPIVNWFGNIKAEMIDFASQKILIPGCGNAWEAEHLFREGFSDVHIIDWAAAPLQAFADRVADFPKENLHHGDFFTHQQDLNCDWIVEQTFFCAINPELRDKYIEKTFSLLKPGGAIAGLLFNDGLNNDKPPFGGSFSEYETRFSKLFKLEKLAVAEDSVSPRAGRELFIVARKES